MGLSASGSRTTRRSRRPGREHPKWA